MMRSYPQQHRFYAGINLHARTISCGGIRLVAVAQT